MATPLTSTQQSGKGRTQEQNKCLTAQRNSRCEKLRGNSTIMCCLNIYTTSNQVHLIPEDAEYLTVCESMMLPHVPQTGLAYTCFLTTIYSAFRKYSQRFTFSTALFQNGLNSLFSSKFYKQYPIMTKRKKFV